ncbi:MAG: tetratricopeptide (TPR) repeat protein [Saprospiraceae bacterium]|jgi:tetratricopeptide (TPR) repeat protein
MENNEGESNLLTKVARFENMLSSSCNLYFDREDFQELVDYYLSIHDQDRAKTVLDYAFEQHPGSPELRLAQAHVFIANNLLKDALDLLKELETMQPESGEVLMAKGTVYSRLKIKDKALSCFKDAIGKVEFNEDVYFLVAIEHQHNMEYEKAIKYHRAALKENPDFELSLYEINTCFDCTGDFQKAIVFYNSFIDDNPYNETAWFNLGTMHAKAESYGEAVIAYEYALAINPYFSSALFNKANSLASNDKYKEAIMCYKETFEHESPNYITYCYMGECYERLHNFDEALKYFDKAIKNESTYSDAWLGKAIALDHMNKSLEAYTCAKKALEINDKEPDYWFTCAELEEKLGLIEESLDSMAKAVAIDQTDADLMIHYVQLVYRNMDILSSFEIVNEAISIFPNQAKLYYFKVGLNLCSAQHKEAYENLNTALTFDANVFQFLFDNFPEAKKNQNILEIISQKQD